jgi:circadian clock protein KaiC
MSERLRTGIAGLDHLLGGGLLYHNSVLLKGPPGSGKTTLGIQMLVAGATEFDEPGAMVSFEQFPQQLQRDTASFGWDLSRLTEEKRLAIFFASPDDLMLPASRTENLLVSHIADVVNSMGVKRLLVDSVSHLRETQIGEGLTPRQALLRFLNAVKTLGLTPLLTCEIGAGGHEYEDYLADSVIVLHHERGREGLPDRREIEIVKARGQEHEGGRHPMRITPRGIEVYPHVLPKEPPPAPGPEPLSSGIASLDPILGGGYTAGSSVLVAGMAGTFKTTLAAHFLAEGARRGEPGLLISFQEPAGHLLHFLAQRGIDLAPAVDRGEITVWHRAAHETCVEEMLWHGARLFAERGIRRLVVDSMNDLERAVPSADGSAPALALLLAETAQRGITALLTQRIERVSGRNPIADIRHVSMVDTIIYVGLAEIESQLEKVISVLKHRGAKADPELRGLQCGAHGLEVSAGFAGLSGVLEGSPLGQRKARVEEVFQPLYVLRDFLAVAQDPSLDAAQRAEILGNLQRETGRLIDLLGKHFGKPEE